MLRSLSTRLRVIAFVVAIAAFVGASAASMSVLSGVQDEATSIAGNASPSIRHLSEMRLILIGIDQRLRAAMLAEHASSVREHADAIAAERHRLGRAWSAYHANAAYPLEQKLWPAAERELAVLMGMLERLSRSNELRDRKAVAALQTAITDRSDRLAAQLVALTDYNVEQARASANRIQTAQRRHVQTVLVFNGVALGFALVTFLAAHKRIRRREVELEQRVAELDEFAGRAAHDLTSPLSTANLALDTVTSSVDADPKLKRVAERGKTGIARAQQVVNSLLAFARAGARAAPGASADPAEAIRAVVEDTRPVALAQSVELVSECHASEEALRVHCEPVLLTIVLRNLIDNAIKYMRDDGPRRVTVRAQRMQGAVRLEVEDTGPGVPEDLRQQIFEPYRRGREGRPGIGLGLATVRRIVDAHGGRVSLEASDRGSLFRVDLPPASPAADAEPPTSWRRLLRRALTVSGAGA